MKLSFIDYTAQRKELKKQYHYSDWFGNGNTIDDIDDVIKNEKTKTPNFIWVSGHMGLVDYGNKIIVVGYDDSEYCHLFEFER